MTWSSHDLLIFFGTCSDNPENVEWAPSVFNDHARAASKAKLLMKDHSCKRYKKLCEKRNKFMKKIIIDRGEKYSCYKWPVI